MAHTVSGKLRKAPFTKDGCGQGDSKMYIIELAEVNKDYQTQEKSYTNYKAMFFAKTDNAKAYYDKAFAEGSFVVVSCQKLKVDLFSADNGTTYVTLMMENAQLEGALTNEDQGGQQQGGLGHPQQPAQQQQQQQSAQQPQQQYNEPPQDFDDDIPF
ncbi:hypothetical protein [Vibrio phage P23]|nr:hypothetical protein [Vibrio phage P23]